MKQLMTNVQQAELQGKLWTMLEEFRVRHGLAEASIFSFLVAFAWGYARRGNASHEEIQTRMHRMADACEADYQRATAPRPAS